MIAAPISVEPAVSGPLRLSRVRLVCQRIIQGGSGQTAGDRL